MIHAAAQEGALPGQCWANAQSVQRCSCYACKSLSAPSRTHSNALPDPLLTPRDSFPSRHHLSTVGTGYLSEVSAYVGAAPGRRRNLAFFLVSMQSAADGAAGSSDQPPLWTRENKSGSSAAIDAPRDSASVSRALPTPPRALPSYSPTPFPPGIFHRCSKALLQPYLFN